MIHRINRVLPLLASGAAAFAIFAFIGITMYVVVHQRGINQELCEQTVENRESDRLTWNAARTYILMGQGDREVIEGTNKFFDRVLDQIPSLECRGNQPVPKEG